MTRFWMMGGVAIAVSVGVMAWSPRPTPASEDLLRKAQSEFAIKARDALIQRRMALAPTSATAVPFAALHGCVIGARGAPKNRHRRNACQSGRSECRQQCPQCRRTQL